MALEAEGFDERMDGIVCGHSDSVACLGVVPSGASLPGGTRAQRPVIASRGTSIRSGAQQASDRRGEEGPVQVQVDLNQDITYLVDAHDTHRLLVVVSGTEARARADAVLGDAGHLDPEDPDHAWVSVGWLRLHGEKTADGAWGERFDRMLHAAGEAGRLSSDHSLVRVPVEWTLGEELGAEID